MTNGMNRRGLGRRWGLAFVAAAVGGVPLVTVGSCDPVTGTLEIFRDDDFGDVYYGGGYFDGYFYNDFYYDDFYYDDCFDCYYEEIIYYP